MVNFSTIRCCNKRSKTHNGQYVSNSICGHFLAQIEFGFLGNLVLYCSACKSFFLYSRNENKATITLIDKNDIDFSKVAKMDVIGYQSKI